MRVIVTRPAERARPLVGALERAGFEVVVCPLIDVELIDDGPIDVSGYDWVIITSATGADQLARRRVGDVPRVAAIGDATAAAVRARGFEVDFVPSMATQEGLVAEFPRPAGRVLFVGAEGARRLIVEELDADFRAVYRTRRLSPDPPPAGELAVLASPSSARALAALDRDIPTVTIGPQTTIAARDAGLVVLVQARTPDVASIVAAVQEATG